jgi:hypothetical protein
MKNESSNYRPAMKYKFEPGVWLSFTYAGAYCIGITILLDDEVKIVASVSIDGKTGHIPFNDIENPKKINFLNSDNRMFYDQKNPKIPATFIKVLNTNMGLN